MGKKEVYKEKVDALLKQIGAQINKLIDAADKAGEKFKDIYVKNIETQFKQLSPKIDKLKEAANKTKSDVKTEYHKQINLLQDKQKLIKDKLQTIKKSSGEAWVDLKAGVDKSTQEFKRAVTAAISRFK